MKTLVTPQFNSAMKSLSTPLQQEVSAFFNFLNNADKEHIYASSFTQIVSSENDIFTLRGVGVRIFCTFSMESDQEVIVLLDINPIRDGFRDSRPLPITGEVTLFGASGDPIAYIEKKNDMTIYTFSGEPLAYIDDRNNIYGFNGAHLGWFEDQVVRARSGEMIGFTKNTCPNITRFEPFKGFKQFKPFKSIPQVAPIKPMYTSTIASIGLLEFLKAGK